jgi:hypothetical protein
LEATQRFRDRLKDLRRLDINVELQDECQVRGVKAAVMAVCCVLSEMRKLDNLRIKLDGRGHFNADRALESFNLLRNVREVVLDEVPLVYAQYLKSKMTSCDPLVHLPKMYEALQGYAGSFDCCDEVLQEACDAMEEDNVDPFIRATAKTIPIF